MKRNYFLYAIVISIICVNAIPKSAPKSLPKSFGKTHFIVGVDSQKIIKKVVEVEAKKSVEDILRTTQHGVRHVLFAPDDNVLEFLISLIEKETKSIKMAAFLLTEKKIIDAIVNAKKRGIVVEIVFDPRAVKNKYAKTANILKNKGIKIFVYNYLSDNNPASNVHPHISNIMHNKFIVFGENFFKHALVWTGSFNFTYSAHKVNQENVVIFDDIDFVNKFTERFDHMKNNLCLCYKIPKK